MYDIAFQLSIILIAALVGGVITFRLRQPLVVGYLITGVILGNLLPKHLIQSEFISFFGELGIAFLLFSLGLEFSIKRIGSIGKTAVLGGVLQILICILAGFFIFPLIIHNGKVESVFVAILVAFSSTAVVAKILAEKGALDSLHGEILVGWLIVQDLAVLPIMALIPIFAGSSILPKDVFITILKPLVILYLVLFFGRKIIPKVFTKLALLHSRELMVLSSFVFCITFAFFANKLGLSFALGAFLAGVALSSSGLSSEVFSEIKSVRDVFGAVFFVSLGFLVSAPFLGTHIASILLLSLIILLIKFIIVFVLVLYLGYHSKIAFLVGVGLVQIGEFSFILAKIGLDKGIISEGTFQFILSSAVLTVIATPFLFDKAEDIYEKIRRIARKKWPKIYESVFVNFDELIVYSPKDELKDYGDHVVLVGYGRVGMSVAHILDKVKVKYVVVDINYGNLKYLRNRGVPNIFGDAEDTAVLKLAKLDRAKTLIIAKPGKEENEHILRIARRINPNIKVVIRVHSEEEAAHFVIEGVKFVTEPEFTASIDIADKALLSIGFSKEDREALLDRIKSEHRY